MRAIAAADVEPAALEVAVAAAADELDVTAAVVLVVAAVVDPRSQEFVETDLVA